MPQGRMYGELRTLNWIGGGGNGVVYRCQKADGTEAAIKVLRRDRDRRRDRIVRFRNEVQFLISQGRRAGVMPLLDHALPDDPGEPSWYVMPLAIPLLKKLGNPAEFPRVVEAVGHIAQTLAELAAEGVSHRDIKPENLFWLDNEWVIGDFGLVKYPKQEPATRQGQRLGPQYFMAPEMQRIADTADAELADVYSLAKTLWVIAVGDIDPPPGELRRDRAASQLSSHVEHRRANLLEPLLERCTAHDLLMRPRMRELAEELSWWAEPNVSVQPDLSHYATEVAHLRRATTVVKEESKRERLEKLYNEAGSRVDLSLTTHLSEAMKQAGLSTVSFVPRTPDNLADRAPDNWVPENYGGGANLPRWGIETLSSPWLAASIGVVHRAQPEEDLEDLAVTAVLAMMTPDSQHTYIQEHRHFRPGSLRLDQIMGELKAQFDRELPGIIAHFLTTCKQIGVSR
ncbi:MAG: protein kinase domain-containing protein [Pseudonocardiaceae bacterium]